MVLAKLFAPVAARVAAILATLRETETLPEDTPCDREQLAILKAQLERLARGHLILLGGTARSVVDHLVYTRDGLVALTAYGRGTGGPGPISETGASMMFQVICARGCSRRWMTLRRGRPLTQT